MQVGFLKILPYFFVDQSHLSCFRSTKASMIRSLKLSSLKKSFNNVFSLATVLKLLRLEL